MNTTTCPCGSNQTYAKCCESFLLGKSFPSTPEALMRSRYSAFTFSNIDYISQTMTGVALKNFNADNAKAWAKKIKWLGLKVVHSSPIENNHGTVEFIVDYILDGRRQTLHEISEFQHENDRWYYVDGAPGDNVNALEQSEKIGRNDPCPCGSGDKYKKCCGV
jgi:SEC-C motif-containing protein